MEEPWQHREILTHDVMAYDSVLVRHFGVRETSLDLRRHWDLFLAVELMGWNACGLGLAGAHVMGGVLKFCTDICTRAAIPIDIHRKFGVKIERSCHS